MELLLCHLLGIERIEIYSQFDKPLTPDELSRLREMVIRRAKREPLQYIIGSTDFMGLTIRTGPAAIVPRPETELLAEKAIAAARDYAAPQVLDIGCGSGCISIAIAKKAIAARVDAIDISEDALALARENAQINNVENIYIYKCNIFETLSFPTKFDIIVSNPPYIPYEEYKTLEPEVGDYEPEFALTDGGDGLGFYRRLAVVMARIMQPEGVFLLEMGAGQAGAVGKIFAPAFDIKIYNDMSGIARIAIGKYKTGGES